MTMWKHVCSKTTHSTDVDVMSSCLTPNKTHDHNRVDPKSQMLASVTLKDSKRKT